MASSSVRISTSPTSPACRISSTLSKAGNTSGRSFPCVSLIRPMRTSVGLAALPPGANGVVYFEVHENPADHEVYEVVDRFRAVVETRGCGENHGTRARQSGHVLQMDERVRCLARD